MQSAHIGVEVTRRTPNLLHAVNFYTEAMDFAEIQPYSLHMVQIFGCVPQVFNLFSKWTHIQIIKTCVTSMVEFQQNSLLRCRN